MGKGNKTAGATMREIIRQRTVGTKPRRKTEIIGEDIGKIEVREAALGQLISLTERSDDGAYSWRVDGEAFSLPNHLGMVVELVILSCFVPGSKDDAPCFTIDEDLPFFVSLPKADFKEGWLIDLFHAACRVNGMDSLIPGHDERSEEEKIVDELKESAEQIETLKKRQEELVEMLQALKDAPAEDAEPESVLPGDPELTPDEEARLGNSQAISDGPDPAT